MVVRSLDEVKDAVNQLAPIIQPPEDLLPTYGVRRDNGYPHIEIDGTLMSYVTMERGQETERRSSTELDDILYWVFESVTFSMAADWELHHRVEGQDFRRLLWTKQLELLDALNPTWTARCRADLGHLIAEVGL